MPYGPLDRAAGDESNRLIQRLLVESKDRFGVDPTLLLRVISESDDWSFVVQVHTLAEMVVQHLLTNAAGHHPDASRLAKSRLPLGRKLNYLERAKLLTPWKAAQLRTLSALRNRLVHDFRGLGFTFDQFATEDPLLSKRVAKAFSKAEEAPGLEERDALEQRALSNSQQSVAIGVLSLLVTNL